MKTAQTKRNRIVSYLRFTASSAFFAAAAALAFVVATPNVLTTNSPAATKSRRPLIPVQAHDKIGPEASEKNAKDGKPTGPARAAAEKHDRRAYPGPDEIEFSLTLNSMTGFQQFVATSPSTATPTPRPKGPPGFRSKLSPPEPPRFHNWSMQGPSDSETPAIITFSGGPTEVSGRVSALALDPTCGFGFCRLWVGAAGGGVWRTTNALSSPPTWTFLTRLNVASNAIGAITYVPPFAGFPDGILYVGTGEANQSGDSEAGLGIFASTNGGDTWAQVPGKIGPITTTSPAGGGTFSPNGTYTGNAFFGRSISSIAVNPTNPSIVYVSSTRGVRGVAGSSGGGTTSPPTPRPPYGLFKSTDGGRTFTFVWDGGNVCPGSCLGGDLSASVRGVSEVKLDPTNPNTVYASAFPGQNGTSGGVYRSLDGGTSWTQIYVPIDSVDIFDRATFDVTTLPSGDTRMYVGDGNDGADVAHVFRSNLVEFGAPAFTDLTAAEVPAGQSADYCHGQCWYDNVVVVSPDNPDIVYIAGSYDYGTCGGNSDCRAVLASDTAGASWFDWTWDSQDNGMPTGPYGQCCNPNQTPVVGPAPNQMHPDHHAIVQVPAGNVGTFIIIDGSDGGVTRTDGNFTDQSFQCTGVRTADGSVTDVPLCTQLLGNGGGNVPNLIVNMNFGLATLLFQGLSVAPTNDFLLQGGTQDNGTFDNQVGPFTWNQLIFGDGGASGFSSTNSGIRFNTFTFQANAGNFRNGDPNFWVLISGPILVSPEFSYFYPPVIADPHFAAGGTIFEGSEHVWRTTDHGGSQGFLEGNCQVWFQLVPTSSCGDFAPLGGPTGHNNAGALPGTFYGGSRVGGFVSSIARTTSNTNTAWAATGAGRVFISTNINASPSSVVWNRVDGASKDPTRFPADIAIDPANPSGHAWVVYEGYSQRTPTKPGHIFSVTWDGIPGDPGVWTNISYNLPDIPITSIVFDPVTGDLYAGSDFTVFRLAFGHTVWDVAGIGLPIVEVPKLAIAPGTGAPGTGRVYAGTHGLSAWSLPLYGR